MESTVVIKVKYAETLRRFSARVDENERLDLDMGRLRGKVLSLFNIAPDADLTLTYIDEDGDVVALVDEEDLHDVVRQSLNPLRITVRLNTERDGRSYARSSGSSARGSSTPMRSPEVQHPLPNLNTGVAEILKSVPEPFREALSKMSADLAIKAASSAPGLAELVESFSRMGQTYHNPVSDSQAVAQSSTPSGLYGSTMSPSVSKDDGATTVMLPMLKVDEPALKMNQDGEDGNVNGVVGASVKPAFGSVNLDTIRPAGDPKSEFSSGNLPGGALQSEYAPSKLTSVPDDVTIDNKDGKKSSECHLNTKSKSFRSESVDLIPDAPTFPTGDNLKEKKKSTECHRGWKRVGDSKDGIPLANNSAATNAQFAPCVYPFKRSYNHRDGMGSVFHKGVQCDGCGVHPITGPRFRSKVKEDYDLCSICFSVVGNEVDYIRMDHPVSYYSPWSLKGCYYPQPYVRPPTLAKLHPPTPPTLHPPTIPHVLGSCGIKPNRPKLDCRFIHDVNVLDGTVMAPSTPFTKIWRMRNNGTFTWPRGTQLMWIGGDRLSNTLSVEVEEGVFANKGLDIAVDFTAPELPGRYISYWRMATPSGQKFGQRVWVLIQVDASLKDKSDSSQVLNLNLPPSSNGMASPRILNASDELMVDNNILQPDNSNRTDVSDHPLCDVSVQPLCDGHLNKNLEPSFPVDGSPSLRNRFPNPLPMEDSEVFYPITGLSELAPTAPHAPPPVTNLPADAEGVGGNNDVEETLLRELEGMGFKQVDLNKEILRMNEYDLEQSVDDLCGASGWDPMLQELMEMGFYDYKMNKRLLKKNKGSMKHVVMDLISGEEA